MLRLEHLFDRLGQLVARDAPVDHHFALATIFEIMDVASRADLKSDLLKETGTPPHAVAGLPRPPGHCRGCAGRRHRPHRPRVCRAERAAGQGGPGPGQQRLADEHPQPHQHPRRHLRVRPAGLLRLAAARAQRRRDDLQAGWPRSRPLAEALQVLLGLLRDSGTPQRMVAPAASTSRACRRARSTSCCACASTKRWAWCPRSAATA
jgi:cell division protein ZapD